MKIQIRRGTFETNSSSMHSLVIMKDNCEAVKRNEKEHIYIGKNGKYRIHFEEDLEFERAPFRLLSKPSEKFCYLIACFRNDEDKREEIIEAFKKVYPEIKEVVFPNDYYSENKDEYYYGSIDHQSDGIGNDFLKDYNISFYDFLSNPKYKVVIDGDEYDTWGDFKRSGIIRLEDIDFEYDGTAHKLDKNGEYIEDTSFDDLERD